MKFKLEIDMGNAAFEGRAAMFEIKRIVTDMCKFGSALDTDKPGKGPVYDINGNKVGTWEVKE